ncbi:MAG: glycoside hydrolase family 16 protein, partial [Terriglobia bacterium]
MKLPVGDGLWPAFWLLGTAGRWPAGGEIDVMENVPAAAGLGPTSIASTLNGPDSKKTLYSVDRHFTFPGSGRVDDTNPLTANCQYHVYGVIWSPFMIQFYVDNWRRPFYIRTASDLPAGGKWVFNRPNHFYVLLNLAVGGKWPGNPSPATPSPAEALVDYVRVYRSAPAPGPNMSAGPITVKAGETASSTIHLTSIAGAGRDYLACSKTPQNTTCSINTGDPLSSSVVDFSSRSTGTATVTVTTQARSPGGGDHIGAQPGSYGLTVTAYTVSGDRSAIRIHLTVN